MSKKKKKKKLTLKKVWKLIIKTILAITGLILAIATLLGRA